MQNTNNSKPGGSSLDTLAQTGTKVPAGNKVKAKTVLRGSGSDLNNSEALQKKGERKMITQTVILSVIDIAKNKGNQKLVRSLWNAYHCQRELITAEERIYTRYCRNRLCSVCCGIRKAEKMRRYLPIVQTWAKPYFVTLTARSVPAKSLPRRMKDMNRGLRLIIEKHRKQAQRGKGIKLVGFKALECNFNAERRSYNPHLHLMVENEEVANILIKDWLALCTIKFASPKAQLALPVTDTMESMVELIKYNTKQLTEPDPNNKKKKGSRYVYAAATYNIITAMKGLRIFDRFGFDLSKSTRHQSQSKEVSSTESWKYNPKAKDWLNTKEQRLTGYLPSQELIDALTNNINSELE